jgi:formylmethanofuran dehydrogenase subunit E
MFITDDPVADFHRYCNEQEEKLKRLPRCDRCKHRIQDDYYYIDEETLCEGCMNNEYRKSLDDYLDSLEE